MNTDRTAECNLQNEELINRVDKWDSKLCKSGGKDWCLTIPVDLERDPDVLICELINRFKESQSTIKELVELLEKCERFAASTPTYPGKRALQEEIQSALSKAKPKE